MWCNWACCIWVLFPWLLYTCIIQYIYWAQENNQSGLNFIKWVKSQISWINPTQKRGCITSQFDFTLNLKVQVLVQFYRVYQGTDDNSKYVTENNQFTNGHESSMEPHAQFLYPPIPSQMVECLIMTAKGLNFDQIF